MFPYAESKDKFVNDKNLKRANFQEAISQIEAVLSGKGDASPISTQPENGDAKELSAEAPPKPVVATPPVTASPALRGKTQQQKTETATTPPAATTPAKTPKQRKAVSNAQTAKSKASANKGNPVTVEAEEEAPTPMSPPPEKVEEASSPAKPSDNDDIMAYMQPKPTTPEEESPINTTSRSGRKIKPKK